MRWDMMGSIMFREIISSDGRWHLDVDVMHYGKTPADTSLRFRIGKEGNMAPESVTLTIKELFLLIPQIHAKLSTIQEILVLKQ